MENTPSRYLREVTEQEARAMCDGLQPLMTQPDRAVIMLGPDLVEHARCRVWRQDWLTADGTSVSHSEYRIPAAGKTWVCDSKVLEEFTVKSPSTGGYIFVNRCVVPVLEPESEARLVAHELMEAALGEKYPPGASLYWQGGWHADTDLLVGARPTPRLSRSHEHDIGNLVTRAWRDHEIQPAASASEIDFLIDDLL